jgi:hypothetical protein
VTFKFFSTLDCTGAASTESGVAVGDPSSNHGPLGAGSYSFNAQYIAGSDPNHNDSAVSACEPLTISKADSSTSTDIHDDTTHAVVTSVALGSTVHDSAAVSSLNNSFTIGGNVSFTFYNNGTCAGSGTAAGTVAVSSGVAHPSSSEGPLAAGSYSFKATYSGDSNYNGSSSACEPFKVNKANVNVTTQVHNASHTDITGGILSPGTAVHDKATVGTQVNGFVIGGTVTYNFYNTYDCTGAVASTQTVAVGTESSTITPPSGAHSYCVTYNGDSNYNSSTSAPEPFTILGKENGLTLGYYGNQNGQFDLTGSKTGTTLKTGIYNTLFAPTTGLLAKNATQSVLVDGSGNYKLLSFFSSYANVRSYLLNASATNMAYMLSAQLLTTEFNVYLGRVDATKSIYVPAVTLPTTGQFMSSTLQNALITQPAGASPWTQVSIGGVANIQAILNASIAQLKANPNTIASGGNRTYQEALKDLLDGINNNEAIFLP